jgi:hypothetical protein
MSFIQFKYNFNSLYINCSSPSLVSLWEMRLLIVKEVGCETHKGFVDERHPIYLIRFGFECSPPNAHPLQNCNSISLSLSLSLLHELYGAHPICLHAIPYLEALVIWHFIRLFLLQLLSTGSSACTPLHYCIVFEPKGFSFSRLCFSIISFACYSFDTYLLCGSRLQLLDIIFLLY